MAGASAPSCTTRRISETAAHLTDHCFPCLPVHQWALSVLKRLRFFMQRGGAVFDMVLRIFLRVIAHTLQTSSPSAAHVDKATMHIGTLAFIHRFGSSLNEYVHFHVCVVDGVFETMAGEVGAGMQGTAPASCFIRPPAWTPKRRPKSACAGASCKPLWVAACSKALKHMRCWATSTAGFR